jgi:hypothetical protein
VDLVHAERAGVERGPFRIGRRLAVHGQHDVVGDRQPFHEALDRLPPVLRVADEGGGPGDAQQVPHLLPPGARADADDDYAGLERGEVGDVHRHAVRQQHAHPLATLKTGAEQHRGERVGGLVEAAPGEPVVARDEGQCVGTGVSMPPYRVDQATGPPPAGLGQPIGDVARVHATGRWLRAGREHRHAAAGAGVGA